MEIPETARLLLNLLPAGNTNQQQVASRMHRSLSKLQRQLQAEGTNYMEIREDTRQSLGGKYVRERKLSMHEIAFLLGFADQSNFPRAFKRWTGMTPRQFQSDEMYWSELNLNHQRHI